MSPIPGDLEETFFKSMYVSSSVTYFRSQSWGKKAGSLLCSRGGYAQQISANLLLTISAIVLSCLPDNSGMLLSFLWEHLSGFIIELICLYQFFEPILLSKWILCFLKLDLSTKHFFLSFI